MLFRSSCLDHPAAGCTTAEQLKEVFSEDVRIVAALEKEADLSREEALLELYKKMRPGDPPTIESAETLFDGMFFERARYDLFKVGRYKLNKKLALARRITGHALASPVADPLTGEVIADAGEVLTREKAEAIEDCGVLQVFIQTADKPVRVFSNGMVKIDRFIDFDPADLGIDEKVHYIVLRGLLEQHGSGEELKRAIKDNLETLIPMHVTVDDIFSTVNYLCCLAYGIGTRDDIDHLGNRRVRSVGELLQNQFRIGFSRMEIGRAHV